MRGRWHFILGIILAILIYSVYPAINLSYLALLFISSWLIDIDHYIAFLFKTGTFSISEFFADYKKKLIEEKILLKKGIRKKGDFHIFHTIEFHALIAFLILFNQAFIYILIGLVFHSILDVIDLSNRGVLHRREYFFFNWLKRQLKAKQ